MPFVIFAFVFLQLLAVSYLDLKYKKISNWWSLFNLLLFAVLPLVFPAYYVYKFEVFYFSLIFLLVGLVLFALKVMGAGDTKYLFSFFPLIPISFHQTFLVLLLQVTILVGGSLLIFNTVRKYEKIIFILKTKSFEMFKEVYGSKFSFAPVILVSWGWFGWVIQYKLTR